jgi:hypothetical protein
MQRAGEAGTLIVFKPSGTKQPTSDAVMAAARAAIGVANAAVPAEAVTGGAVVASKAGPLLNLGWDGVSSDAIEPWLSSFAASLTGAGLSGAVRVPPERTPGLGVLHEGPRRTSPTMLAGYRVTYLPAPATADLLRFMASSAATRRLAQHVAAWGAALPDQQAYIVVGGIFTAVGPSDLSEMIYSAAELNVHAIRVWYFAASVPAGRRLTLVQLGQVVIQEANAYRPWQELVDETRQHLLLDPDAVDVAHIRNTTANVGGWQDLQYAQYTPGHVPPFNSQDYVFNRHLWHTRVLDAHGIQLLTEDHLNHAHNLNNDWTTTQVTPGRYLVEAKDLTPWYATDTPDPDTLQQARHDFGDIILTWEHVNTTPGPYTRPH